MAEIERMTITLPADMATVVKNAAAGGDYASNLHHDDAIERHCGRSFPRW